LLFSFAMILACYFVFTELIRPYYLSTSFIQSKAYTRQVNSWNNLKINSESTVFIGNSLIQRFEVSSFGDNVYKMAIGGDVLSGLEGRLPKLLMSKPKIVIVNMGINDIVNGFGYDINLLDDFFQKLKSGSPNCTVLIMSLGPQNLESGFFTNPNSIQKKILEANTKIKTFCKVNQLNYIDVYSHLSENDLLRNEFSLDGLHLTEKGYEIWSAEIKKALSLTP